MGLWGALEGENHRRIIPWMASIFQMSGFDQAEAATMAATGLIQIQVNFGGNWRTVRQVANVGSAIANGMMGAQRTYPDKRVRAVDSGGHLVDML